MFNEYNGNWIDLRTRLKPAPVEIDDYHPDSHELDGLDYWQRMDKGRARNFNALIIRSTDVRACTPRQIPSILREWRNPRHEEFRARTLWTLFNSFTEVLKGNLNELPKRTEATHGLLDSYVGLPQFSQN